MTTLTTTLTFAVYGAAAPQGSKKHVGRGIMVESSKRLAPWREDVKVRAEEAISAWENQRRAAWDTASIWEPLTGPVEVDIAFRFARPASHYGTGRNAGRLRPSAPERPTSKNLGDIEKLVRAVHDALTAAGVWKDDAQVVTLSASKRWCDDLTPRPGVAVMIRDLP